MFMFNFQTRNKIKLCDLKTKTLVLQIRTPNVQNKRENESLSC